MLLARPLLGLTLGPDYAADPGAFRLVMLGALANSYSTMLYPCLSAQGLARWGIAAFALGSAVAAAGILAADSGPRPCRRRPRLRAGASLAAVAVIVLAYRRRFGFAVAEILLPQTEDARALREIGCRTLWGGYGARWVANVILQPRAHLNGMAELSFSAISCGSKIALPPLVAKGSCGDATTTFCSGSVIWNSWAYACATMLGGRALARS